MVMKSLENDTVVSLFYSQHLGDLDFPLLIRLIGQFANHVRIEVTVIRTKAPHSNQA